MNIRRRPAPGRPDVPPARHTAARAKHGARAGRADTDATDTDTDTEAAAGARVRPVWRLRVRMDDRPGTLARVAIRLAELECNVLGVTVLPVPGGVLDEIVVRPGPGVTRADVLAAVDREDCEGVGVCDADVHDLVDPATASLAAARRVVTTPDDLADAVRELLGAEVVTVVPEDESNPGRDEAGHRAAFAVGDGRALVARRRWAPFLHQELARVDTLLALRAEVSTNLAGPAVATCADGAELVLRDATAGDTDAVILLHEHCSPSTLARRYRGSTGVLSPRRARELLSPAHGTSVVVVCGREVVALGQLIAAADTPPEVRLLVEDGWQRNGVGTALLRRLSALAASRGHDELVVATGGDAAVAGRTATRAGLEVVEPAAADGYLRVALSR